MAQDYIRVNVDTATSRTNASELLTFIQHIRRAKELGNKLQDVFNHNVEDPDYADLEPHLGIPAAEGQVVYNLLVGALAEIEADVNAMQIIGRVGD